MSRKKNAKLITKPIPLMKIRKNVKLCTNRFMKKKKNVRLPTPNIVVTIVIAPAMVMGDVNAMAIKNAKKCPMKVVITLKFQEMYLKKNVTTSKFPSIQECQKKNVTTLRCPSIPKYLKKAATMLRCPSMGKCPRKNVTMLRCPNATKFQRKSATPPHTNLERGMEAATAATIAAMGAIIVVR